jgi:hypothetical protein
MCAMSIDGANDLLNCGSNTVLDNLVTRTCTAWIRFSGIGEGSGGRIFDKGSGLTSGWLFFLAGASNALRFYLVRGTTDSDHRSATTSVSINTTYHVAVSYDSTLTTNSPVFYVNGAVSATTVTAAGSGAATADGTQSLLIGNNVATDRSFQGWIEDARVYNRILTANEILTIKNAMGRDNIIAGLVGRWLGVGTQGGTMGNEPDLSGNVNTAVPSNGPTFTGGIVSPNNTPRIHIARQ